MGSWLPGSQLSATLEELTPVALPLVIVGDLLDAAVVVVCVPGQEPRVLLVGDQQAGGGQDWIYLKVTILFRPAHTFSKKRPSS